MKKINRLLPQFLIILIVVCSTLLGQTTATRSFSGIEGVAMLGSGNLSITSGEKEEITIFAPADLLPYLITEMKGSTLQIGKRKMGWKKFRHFNEHIRYKLVVKQLDHISVSGSGDIEADRLSGNTCSISVSGSGNVHVENVKASNIKIQISGSGDVDISKIYTDITNVGISGSGDIQLVGKADALDLTISGSGNFDGEDFGTDDATISIYGSGDAGVNVSQELKVQIFGSGDVTYKGNPLITSRITGSGDIQHR